MNRKPNKTNLLCIKGHLKLGENRVIHHGRLECRTCNRLAAVKRRSKLKIKVLKLLGSKCVCCELDMKYWWVLTVDHIIPKHKRTIYESSVTFYLDILSGKLDKNEFQILCNGCNGSKNANKFCGLDHSLKYD